MEKLFLPTNVEFIEKEAPNEGTLVVYPCYHGYGTTLGNALRRVLLSSLPGAAVTAVKIKGVPHEFMAIPNIKEDVIEIILNLKELRLKCFSENEIILKLSKKGVGSVKASDIQTVSDVEIMNPELVLANITDEKGELDMEITVNQGRGYGSAETRDKKTLPLGTIAIDSLYSPVRDVGYKVEYMRVGDITNYEKLYVDIVTDGTVSPKEAVRQTVAILLNHFDIIAKGGE